LSTPLPVEKIDPNGIREPDGIFPGSPDLRDLTHSKIGSWREFRATLRPRYGRAWMDIFFCLAMLFGGYAAHLGLTWRLGNLAGAMAAPVFAVWVGFWLNALLTFGHEAAHYNLSSSKVWNDFLADWSIWLFFPQSSKSYRKIHWQHHLHLGDLQDTEISYHNCMSPWFLAKALSGVYVVEVLARYALNKGTKPNPRKDEESANPITRQGTLVAVARAGAIHFVFVGAALYLRCYATAATWLVGAALVFPFLATVRQMLEHRDEEAHCATDYREVPQGAVNRMFGKNLFSRFYGAAGFNRHLLHHWDPTVSYTCFDEMENFLKETSLRERLERSRTTYVDNLILLTRKARRDLA
jgi:fatty acid desaturase